VQDGKLAAAAIDRQFAQQTELVVSSTEVK